MMLGPGVTIWRRRQAIGTNAPPTVAITSPSAGTTVTGGTTVSVSATAADTDGIIVSLLIYLDDPDTGGTLLGSALSGPCSWSVLDSQAGAHSLYAVTTDSGGARTKSAPISVTVRTNLAAQIANINALSPSWWYFGNDARIDATNLEGGQRVDRWNDKSSNARNTTVQSTQTRQPALILDGSDYGLQFSKASTDTLGIPTNGISGSSGFTLWLAVRFDAVASGYVLSYDTNAFAVFISTSTPRFFLSSSAYGAADTVANGDRRLYIVRVDGAGGSNATRMRLRTNQADTALSFSGTIPPSVAALTAGAVAASSGAASPSDLTIYSAGVIPSVLSDSNTLNLESYLVSAIGWI